MDEGRRGVSGPLADALLDRVAFGVAQRVPAGLELRRRLVAPGSLGLVLLLPRRRLPPHLGALQFALAARHGVAQVAANGPAQRAALRPRLARHLNECLDERRRLVGAVLRQQPPGLL